MSGTISKLCQTDTLMATSLPSQQNTATALFWSPLFTAPPQVLSQHREPGLSITGLNWGTKSSDLPKVTQQQAQLGLMLSSSSNLCHHSVLHGPTNYCFPTLIIWASEAQRLKMSCLLVSQQAKTWVQVNVFTFTNILPTKWPQGSFAFLDYQNRDPNWSLRTAAMA